MTHQGSRALNQTMRTHAPYSANATNQVGPSTWKNFCFRYSMAWLQALSLPVNHEFREGQPTSAGPETFTLAPKRSRRPETFTRARTRTPDARLQRADDRANTGLPSQNSIAMHHKRPDPGGQIGPRAIPPSKEQWRRSDVLQGKRLA